MTHNILHNRIARYGSAVALLVIVVATLAVMHLTTPRAYALEQTIKTISKVHFLHTVLKNEEGYLIDERWIEMGPDGNQARYRQYADLPEHGIRLLIIDDGNVCYAYDRVKNEVTLEHSGTYQWIYNLADFFRQVAGDNSLSIEQYVQYRGKAAHKVRWMDGQMECYIDPETRLPIMVGGMEISYGVPPEEAFVVPSAPQGVKVVDMRGDSTAAKQAKNEKRIKDKLFSDGRKALEAGEFEKAVKSFDGAIDLSPLENWIWYWRGEAYAGLGQWEQAITNYTQVIEMFKTIKSTGHYAYLARGFCWQHLGESQKAEADLAVALPVMIDCLRYPEGGKKFDYADNPTNINAALNKFTPLQRQENMIRRLKKTTGQNFGLLTDNAKQREHVIRQWELWWEQNASDYLKSASQ